MSIRKLDPTGMYSRDEECDSRCHLLDPTGLY